MRRAAIAIGDARRVVPTYASGEEPVRIEDVRRIAAASGVEIQYRAMELPSLLMPPIGGVCYLLVDTGLHRATREYVLRHELGHRLAGDADEPTLLYFRGALPEAEYVADLFAFADLVTREECAEGVAYIAARMRELVVLDYRYWYLRIPELAPRLIELRKRVDE